MQFVVHGIDMTLTTDQLLVFPPQFAALLVAEVATNNCTGTVSAAVGGIYDAAGKTGNQIVAASTAWSGGLAFPNVLAIVSGQIFFSLTAGNGAAAVCDIILSVYDLQ